MLKGHARLGGLRYPVPGAQGASRPRAGPSPPESSSERWFVTNLLAPDIADTGHSEEARRA